MSGILLLLLGFPLVGGLLLLLWPRVVPARAAPVLGSGIAGLVLALVILLGAGLIGTGSGTGAGSGSGSSSASGAGAGMRYVVDLPWVPALGVRLRFGLDGLSLAMVALTALLVLCCLLSTIRVRPDGGRLQTFVGTILLLEVGMLGTFMALDLLVFFVFFELVLVPMWFVIAVWGDPHDPVGRRRAATTFLLYTVLGSAVMLVGFLVVYASTGTLDLVALAAAHGRGIPVALQGVAAATIGVGLAVKSPMWPLHSWLPDAHAKAPTVGSVLLAGVLLKLGTYGFLRIWLPVLPDGARMLAPWLAGFAAVGIVYGALACLAQRELKRLVAYSSVGHMGFVLLGIATMTGVGVNGAIFAGVAHGLVTGLLFFLAGAIKNRYGTGDLARLRVGLYDNDPRLGGLVVFACVASLGLPGLAGFWGEMLALFGAYDPGPGLGRPIFLVLMGIAGLGAVLTAWYFLGLVRRICQHPETGGETDVGTDGGVDGAVGSVARAARVARISAVEAWSWGPLVALVVLLGVAPGTLLGLTDPVVHSLLGGR